MLVAHVRRLARTAGRVASVCTGATVLAAAGLLDGRRATTHWELRRQLAAQYHPAVTVDPDPIFIRDGRSPTAAGVTSALDLTLAFVEEDHGTELARRVARAPGDLPAAAGQPGADEHVHSPRRRRDHDIVRDVVDHVTRPPRRRPDHGRAGPGRRGSASAT